jgi:hypothetical protein
MTTGIFVVLVICIAGMVINLLFLIRNGLVYKESIRVLDMITKLCKQDINNGKDFLWRYDEYDKIRYDEMLYKFWRPIKSFYKDSPALKEANK